jgi:Zn finger protein HypA/HybF involved in hydrogenase expression
MCGHDAPSDQWYTHEQINGINKIASSYAHSLISNELDRMFGKMARTTRSNKYIKITYKPNRKTTFVNNPIGQRPEWELEIACEKCETRYSVIGSAYFCPCCGYNAVDRVFDESIDTVQKMIESIGDIYITLEKSHGKDKAESMCRSMIEGTLGDVISAFQKFAEDTYKKLMPAKKVKVNDFQIIEKGSKLFYEASGKGYDAWLTKDEIVDANILFQQRHLIEHNHGLIDERYIQNSNDNSYKVGQRVIIRSSDALKLLGYVRRLSQGLSTLLM